MKTTKTLTIKLPTIKDVDFEIYCLPEDIQVRGNAMASGDNEVDKQVEDEIIRQLEAGNEWAWCCVEVRACYRGLNASDFLGACSYKSQRDFVKNSGYYEDMKGLAFNDLLIKIKALK